MSLTNGNTSGGIDGSYKPRRRSNSGGLGGVRNNVGGDGRGGTNIILAQATSVIVSDISTNQGGSVVGNTSDHCNEPCTVVTLWEHTIILHKRPPERDFEPPLFVSDGLES